MKISPFESKTSCARDHGHTSRGREDVRATKSFTELWPNVFSYFLQTSAIKSDFSYFLPDWNLRFPSFNN